MLRTDKWLGPKHIRTIFFSKKIKPFSTEKWMPAFWLTTALKGPVPFSHSVCLLKEYDSSDLKDLLHNNDTEIIPFTVQRDLQVLAIVPVSTVTDA